MMTCCSGRRAAVLLQDPDLFLLSGDGKEHLCGKVTSLKTTGRCKTAFWFSTQAHKVHVILTECLLGFLWFEKRHRATRKLSKWHLSVLIRMWMLSSLWYIYSGFMVSHVLFFTWHMMYDSFCDIQREDRCLDFNGFFYFTRMIKKCGSTLYREMSFIKKPYSLMACFTPLNLPKTDAK